MSKPSDQPLRVKKVIHDYRARRGVLKEIRRKSDDSLDGGGTEPYRPVSLLSLGIVCSPLETQAIIGTG